jgi:hypothetical protein
MARYVVVTRKRHGQKKWLRFGNYAFATKDIVAPLGAGELAAAALAMPCAFVREAERYALVAVLSATAGRNMFVGQDGRWYGGYVPATLRLYPFRMLPGDEADKVLLYVDEDSKLVVDDNPAGEDFFDAQGNPAPVLKPRLEAAMALERNRKSTDVAIAALAAAGVIRPWEIKVKSNEGERPIDGLYRADEAALRELPDETFLNLRKTSALPIAYTQMLSMGQLGVLQRLARVRTQAAAPTPPPSTPLLSALPETLDDLLENLKDDLRPPR